MSYTLSSEGRPYAHVDRVDLRDIVVTGPRDVRLDGLVATLIGEEETKLGVAEITL